MEMNMNLKEKKLFLLDIDGTVSIGDKFIDGAIDFLKYISSVGKYIFITNNSTKGTHDYIEKFSKMGLKTDASNFITAVNASIKYLKKNYCGKKIFVCGTESFLTELEKNGIKFTEKFETDISAVLIAFDSELNYGKIYNACRILSETKADYIATNPDLVCPAPFGFIPDCGSICSMISAAVKKEPLFIGKPSVLMADMCLEATGYSKDETIIVGDRLYTDILIGVNAKIDTAAVLTGETDINEISASDYKPTYVFRSVKEFYEKITVD
jgi:HAD superfamily hydrolase (TIGR01450 family)